MKKMPQMSLALLLTAALLVGVGLPAYAAESPSMSNFTYTLTYTPGMFTDVDEDAWYGYYYNRSVAMAYSLGLMNGYDDGSFRPEGQLTMVQAVTMAARLRAIYEGEALSSAGSPWYRPYVEYAEAHNIIPHNWLTGQEDDPAWRCEMAYVFAHALPEQELAVKNDAITVDSIPDLKPEDSYSYEIIELYRAGILTGNDKYGSFAPYSFITRAQAAAIVSRVADLSQRRNVTLAPKRSQWLNNYTNAEVLDYFMSVAYAGEFDGRREHNIRWTTPILYYTDGTPQEGDLDTLSTLCQKLNSIEGFPGIRQASNYNAANLHIHFDSSRNFHNYLFLQESNVWGYAYITWNNTTKALTDGTVLIANEIPTRLERDSIIYEEVIQSMGLLNDTFDYYESVFYQDSNYQGVPAEIDWALVELLYSPKMVTGAGYYQGYDLADQIIRAKTEALADVPLNPQEKPADPPEQPIKTQWLDDYSNAEVLNYFMSIAYAGEYSGKQDYNLRWEKPAYYSVNGTPQEGDLDTLAACCARLNRIEGFPGIYPAADPAAANMAVWFVSENNFTDYVEDAEPGSWGYSNIWHYYGPIDHTVVLIANEIPTRLERDSIIYEEVIQSLGLLNDTYDYYESVFYQESNEQGVPAEIDWAVVEILYSPKMVTGASYDRGQTLAQQIIEEKTAA